jgi:dihydropyrimidinase
LSLERWVEACCTAPARIFGLAGRKGALAVGADADVVIFDPEREVILTQGDGMHGAGAPGRAPLQDASRLYRLHEHCDYTPYEGFRLTGWPALTMLRGLVIAREGRFVGASGGGRFVARRRSP